MPLLALAVFLLGWLTSLVFTVVGFVPGVVFLWLGALLHEALTGFRALSTLDWALLFGLGAAGLVLDHLALALGAARGGAGRAGVWGAVLGGFLLTLLLGPIGLFAGPLSGALLFELLAGRPPGDALRAALGTLYGLLLGSGAKLFLHLGLGLWLLTKFV